MPNVGKSSLINWVTGRKVVKVADRPGITRGLQWIRLHPDLELADTAGVLPAANLAKRTWETLAILNLVSRSAEDDTQIAEVALAMIHAFYPGQLEKYYAQAAKLRAGRHEPEAQALKAEEPALADIALRFCLLLPGGRPDTTRAAKLLLKDLRSGKIGRITLDRLADAGSGSQEGPGLRARNL